MPEILRKFKSVDHLFDGDELVNDPDKWNEQILAWINELAEIKPHYEKLLRAEEKRQGYHKVYQERKKLMTQTMTQMLDPDELARLKKLAEERVAEREEADGSDD